jgi:hypothetical protein
VLLHTPGPWMFDNAGVYREDGKTLALVRDARDCALIAAAPDMLAALEHIARICEPGCDQSDDDIEAAFAGMRRLSRNAIAKALGT